MQQLLLYYMYADLYVCYSHHQIWIICIIFNLYDNLSNCDNFGSKNVAIAFYDFMYIVLNVVKKRSLYVCEAMQCALYTYCLLFSLGLVIYMSAALHGASVLIRL